MAKTIIHNENGDAKWGSEDHLQVAQTRSFSSLIFELLSEKSPTEQELKVFELILNLSIDHGPDTPSAVKVIAEANEGETISEAVSEGIEEINDTHGGAQEKLMEILYKINDSSLMIKELVSQKLEAKERIAGYGHRIYKDTDPRAQLILNTLTENGFSDEFINIAKDLEKELETQKGNKLPLNIDGAIAVVLCTLGWDSKLGKAVFIIARTPGLCGQYLNNSLGTTSST
jgi:citrate synthase